MNLLWGEALISNRSYVNPQFGESLHSFILRGLLRGGRSDLSGVLSKSGGWVYRPEIPHEMKDYFLGFNKIAILSLYESYVMTFNSFRLFDNPFAHLCGEDGRSKRLAISYKNVFYPSYNKSYLKSSFSIRFCRECIQYQIWKYGFGYFKSEWYVGKQCSVHAVDLSSGIVPLNETPLSYIQKILQGHEIESSHSFELEPRVEQRAVEDARFAPCLQKEVVVLLSSKLSAFPSGYVEVLDYGFLKAHERLAISKLSFRKQLHFSTEVFYEALIEQDYEGALAFLSERVDVTEIQHIDEMLISNKRALLKSKASDCSKCLIPKGIQGANFCPASNLIFAATQKQSVYSLTFNATDEVLNNLKRKIQQYQDALGVRCGESRVRQEITQNERYTEFGGKHAYQKHMNKKKMEILKLKLW